MKETATRMPKNRQFTLAGFKVDPKLLVGFADSFERLNASILTVHLRSGQSDGHREINACVLPLAGTAVAGLKNSPWFVPRRTVIYGIGGAKEATRFVELGINALLGTASDSQYSSGGRGNSVAALPRRRGVWTRTDRNSCKN